MVVDFPKMCAEEAELKRKQQQVDQTLETKRALVEHSTDLDQCQPGPSRDCQENPGQSTVTANDTKIAKTHQFEEVDKVVDFFHDRGWQRSTENPAAVSCCSSSREHNSNWPSTSVSEQSCSAPAVTEATDVSSQLESQQDQPPSQLDQSAGDARTKQDEADFNFIWKQISVESHPADILAPNNQPTNRPSSVNMEICGVCEEPSAGFHFGAYTCEGCKSFFCRNHRKDHLVSTCPKGGQCDVIGTSNRAVCKACRMRKCIKVGMSPANSRFGRRPSWMKNGGTPPVSTATPATPGGQSAQHGQTSSVKTKTEKSVSAAKRGRMTSSTCFTEDDAPAVDEFARRLHESLSMSVYHQMGATAGQDMPLRGPLPNRLDRDIGALCLQQQGMNPAVACGSMVPTHLLYGGLPQLAIPPTPSLPPVVQGRLFNRIYMPPQPVMAQVSGSSGHAVACGSGEVVSSQSHGAVTDLIEVGYEVSDVEMLKETVPEVAREVDESRRSCSPVILRSLLKSSSSARPPVVTTRGQEEEGPLDLSERSRAVHYQERPMDLRSQLSGYVPWDLSKKNV